MAKAEWGAKHTCLSCGAKFYDMGRNPITCPACAAPFALAAPGRPRRARKAEAKVVQIAVATVADDKEASDDDDDDDVSLADGLDDLIDDDDDDEDDALVALASDDDDDDDVLAEADLSKSKGKISDD
ncbi:MAG: TIGR02300 family protein [Proteobacteria bacterium]|nr:TIGR02300 family protein [Pseudomonadota bacterium]